MSGSGEESDYYDATLFPVFVTADVGLETINTCLARAAEWTTSEGIDGLQALYLISDPSAPHPHEPMTLPVGNFTSPFLNASLETLVSIFTRQVSQNDSTENDLMSAVCFMVLDAQSADDGMLRIVQIEYADEDEGEEGEEGEGETAAEPIVGRTARTSWEIAGAYALGAEMGATELGEGEQGFDEGREVVVSFDRYKEIMAEADEEDEEMFDEEDYDAQS